MEPSKNSNYTSKVIRLAFPMAITQLITISSGFLCMAMLAKLGHEVLAASALIYTLNITTLIIFSSLLLSLGILIGHAFGKQHYFHIGTLLQQSWMLALLMCIPTILIFWYIYPILIFFHQDIIVAKIAEDFFHSAILRVPAFYFSICNQQLCYGVHKQKIDMWANMLSMGVLLVSAYILIFGKFGAPELGVTGYAFATVLQSWFYLLFSSTCFYFIPDFKKFNLFHAHRLMDDVEWNDKTKNTRINPRLRALTDLYKIGWPISLQISGEMLAMLTMTALVGWLGINSLAAYQVIMQYQFLIVVPIFAFAQASGILIGQAFGGKQYSEIKKIGQTSIYITALLSSLMGIIFLLIPHILASLYINIHASANTPILHLISILFIVLAISQFFDALRNVLIGSLRGILDTRYPMMIGLATMWFVSLPLAYLLAFHLHWGVIGITIGWACGMLLGAVILYVRWQQQSSQYIN